MPEWTARLKTIQGLRSKLDDLVMRVEGLETNKVSFSDVAELTAEVSKLGKRMAQTEEILLNSRLAERMQEIEDWLDSLKGRLGDA